MSLDRRHFISTSIGAATIPSILNAQQRRPNVIIIITDDQGYGDLSIHGNDKIETPHMDSIANNGAQFTQFHVNPVCSPTRSSLMTGRYYYRTGVTDTFLGRSMMHNDEVTIAELLRGAGYRTGLFGKWHLGDCYPLRSIDQGFEESLNCTGGGLTQPSDPPGNTYFDPMLRHNGKWEKHQGYCTDIFADAAIRFIEKQKANPFFVYMATNAPHDPLQVDEKYAEPFRKKGLADREAKIYGMVKNVDDNIGKVLAKLRELKLEQDTIVVFMTDNGPQTPRYNAGMRGRKGTVYEGGIRVPFFLQWPRRFKAGAKIPQLTAHIDIMPTVLEACGVALPKNLKIDGRSMMPLLEGKGASWQQRTLFFQWHRGERPNPQQNATAMDGRWKLVEGKELYDLQSDPAEATDVAAKHPDIAARLRKEYDAWYADVTATRNYAPPKIVLGSEHEDPTTLTRQDWRGSGASWDAGGIGHWEVEVRRAGKFEITLRMPKTPAAGEARLDVNGVKAKQAFPLGSGEVKFANVTLPAGAGQLKAELEMEGRTTGAHYVDVHRV